MDLTSNTSKSGKTFQLKLTRTLKALELWAQHKFGNRKNFLEKSKWVLQCLDRAEERRSLTGIEFALRIRIREHIFQLAKEKEAKWKQRSGAQWLRLGDRNTRYFHAVANERKNTNSIQGLHNEQGIPIPQEAIEQEIFRHYKDTLGQRRHSVVPFDITGKVGPSCHDSLIGLDQPIIDQEVLQEINHMPKYKACGPDGIPVEFYQSFWEIIKLDLMRLIQEFFNGTCNLKCLNKAAITLVPKKEGPETLTDYRPISVVNTIIKIISKIMATRLQPVMDRLVSPRQTAFIKGRSIMESYAVARELLTFSHKNKIPSVLYKVDFAKAFDTVDWSFLSNLLIE